MRQTLPITRELIPIGGGHTHTLFLRKWGMMPIPGVEVSLVSPSAETAYTGMLPGLLAGHYKSDDIKIDLVKLCQFSGARFIMESVENIEASSSLVHVKGRKALRYDVASVDIGVTSLLPFPLYANRHVHSIKPLNDFVEKWDYFYTQVRLKLIDSNIVIIGGGVGAVEIAMAMAHAFNRIELPQYTISIVDRARVLSGVRLQSRKKLMRNLKRLSINIIENTVVTDVDASHVFCDAQKPIKANFTVLAIGATPYRWLRSTDLPLINGFIEVDKTLRVTSFQNLFAVGDCAHLSYDPRPKAGVFAVRQAPILYSNIKATLFKKQYKNYLPQKYHLKLISLGKKAALLDYILPSVAGKTVWLIKNYLDKSFMNKFKQLPKMHLPLNHVQLGKEIADEYDNVQPLCGGCGAKVADKTLETILSAVNSRDQENVIVGIGDDAAIIRVGKVNQILTTDHLREFNSDLWRFSKIAAIHALGDIWSMGGIPKTAMVNLIIPEGSNLVQKGWLDQIMDGALNVFDSENISIVGGHTSVGKEFTIGFSLTGVSGKTPPLISKAKPKDLLVLTKPIGSGIVLAGEMRLLSKGVWVEKALHWMEKSQKEASLILSEANAMTDVTGFGLVGHLMRICENSNVRANIELESIPFLDGAEELSKAGVRSSIFLDNRSFIETKMAWIPSAKSNLLFDPQTSGGILAAIPQSRSKKLLSALQDKGYCSTIIGNLVEGSPFISVS